MNWEQAARDLLKTMSTTELRKGMDAFGPTHVPGTERRQDGSSQHCFLGCALRTEENVFGLATGLTLGHARGYDLLEYIFENWRHRYPHTLNADWLRSECIRELAERGDVVQPVLEVVMA